MMNAICKVTAFLGIAALTALSSSAYAQSLEISNAKDVLAQGNKPDDPAELRRAVTVAKQAEAQNYLSAMNLGQIAHYLERSKFSPTIEALGVGIPAQTLNYSYQIVPQGDGTKSVVMRAQAKDSRTKSYTGAVFLFQNGEAITAVAGICETSKPSASPPAIPTAPRNASSKIQCSEGSQPLPRFHRTERF